MNTMREVMAQAKKLGVRCTERTFWHYHKLGLLPEGRKISGYGNVIFFPNDTATRLWLIGFLTKQLGLKISDLRRFPWAEFKALPATNNRLPKEFVFAAKRDFENARAACLKKVLASIATLLNEGQSSTAGPAAETRKALKQNPRKKENNRSGAGTGLSPQETGMSRADIIPEELSTEAQHLDKIRRTSGPAGHPRRST